MAYVGWIDTFEGNQSSPLKRRAESEIVRELESLGAIIIAKVCVSRLVHLRPLTILVVNPGPKSAGKETMTCIYCNHTTYTTLQGNPFGDSVSNDGCSMLKRTTTF